MQFISFKKRNTRQYFSLSKNRFSELLGGRMVHFLRLVFGGNINMVADCYRWSQVLLNLLQCLVLISPVSVLDLVSFGCGLFEVPFGWQYEHGCDCYGWSHVFHYSLQCCFSDWWFYLLMLHSYLNYNNFHCGYNLALMVCYNKIQILVYWDECSINDLKQQDLYQAIYIC